MTEHSENVVRPTEPNNRDRPTNEPGGCECMDCGCIFIGGPDHDYCAVCEQNRNESAHERSPFNCELGTKAEFEPPEEESDD